MTDQDYVEVQRKKVLKKVYIDASVATLEHIEQPTSTRKDNVRENWRDRAARELKARQKSRLKVKNPYSCEPVLAISHGRRRKQKSEEPFVPEEGSGFNIASLFTPDTAGVGPEKLGEWMSSQEVCESEKPIPLEGYDEKHQKFIQRKDENTLYPIKKTETLPLRFFDESTLEDHTPQEWLALGQEKHGAPHTRGWAKFYEKGGFKWQECDVLDYNPDTFTYLIEFVLHRNVQKWVDRLALRFADEDEAKWQERVQIAKDRKELRLAFQRYEKFINLQSSTNLQPISNASLQSIFSKIDSIEQIIQVDPDLVKRLATQVEEQYMFSMKLAHIEYHRKDSDLESKLGVLNLPAPFQPTPAPLKDTKDLPQRLRPFHEIASHIKNSDGLKYKKVAQVLLELCGTFANISKTGLVHLDHNAQPTTLEKLRDMQEEYFCNKFDALLVDWREQTMNRIRDLNLGGGFDLYVKREEDYEQSPLRRFLRKLAYLMQDQLTSFVFKSCADVIQFLKDFQEANKELNAFFKVEVKACEGSIVFEPPLQEFASLMAEVVDFPPKLGKLMAVDAALVPFITLDQRKLCTPRTCGPMYTRIEETQEKMAEILRWSETQPQEMLAKYAEYSFVLSLDSKTYAKSWFNLPEKQKRNNKINTLKRSTSKGSLADSVSDAQEEDSRFVPSKSLQETRAEIDRFCNAQNTINNLTRDEETAGMYSLDFQQVKQTLINAAGEIVNSLLDFAVKEVHLVNEGLIKWARASLARIQGECSNIETLSELKKFLEVLTEKEIPEMRSEIDSMEVRVQMLYDFNRCLPENEFETYWQAKQGPKLILDVVESTKMRILEEEHRFRKELEVESKKFADELAKFTEFAEEFSQLGPCDDESLEKRARDVETFQEKLSEAAKTAAALNRKEKLFNMIKTEYIELTSTKNFFEPYAQVWTMASVFVSSHVIWNAGPFIDLDPKKIEKEISSWYSALHKLEKRLNKENPGSETVGAVGDFKSRINKFRSDIPVIRNLRNPGLRQRHWKQISEALGQKVEPNKFLTYEQLLELNIKDCLDSVDDICTTADKEYGLEQALATMKHEWSEKPFQLKEYKGTYKLIDLSDDMETLDDHIVKTQTMSGSPYIEPFKIAMKKWEDKLKLISEVLEEWLQVQTTWMSLEPVFGSPDIMRQMPSEGKKFQKVDAVWRTTMRECFEAPDIIEFAPREQLLESLQNSNKLLEEIQKGLNAYLETKRLAFPRFYFLSNDELLDILSQTKDPHCVQPHLAKCFDQIAKVKFDAKDRITHMVSSSGEEVEFLEFIDPNEGSRKGNPEVWLKDIESAMVACLRKITYQCYQAYPQSDRTKWILDWPSQCILCISQAYWTAETEAELKANGTRGLKTYLEKLNGQLKQIVKLVRGDLTKLARKTMSPLVVIDVHARDTIQEMLENKVSRIDDFDWLAQLRYYMEGDQLMVHMINAALKYGYEYGGNEGRLVITPLTDRCYRTLMGALKLYYGGAPEGPAGTGKTETVKDLAKALANQCIVYNCSDSLDYLAMAKFFKGLAASGAWACFDEFNRIQLEVLSVIAQQILTIQMAIREGKVEFHFEGVDLPLTHTCAVFITMNPGYAGRAELPDNLKALFRTVAMMVPDYAMIAEILLYSFGYSQARPLSKKIVGSVQLASEQLSSQYHYDFGMRNVISILKAAGKLKRRFPDSDENELALRAINDCNLSKFTSKDIPLFDGITSDLFPKVVLPAPDYEIMNDAIRRCCKHYNLQPTDVLMMRCSQVYETMCVRHGFMVVGEPYGGKSSFIKLLTSALTLLAEEKKLDQVPVDVYYINPKAQPVGKLYGCFDEATHEWSNGILASTVRECASNTTVNRKWIVFDGPVDARWIEDMNTVLDDNKKLCLASGEIIKLTERMSIVFEVDDLSVASPATISRVGMVYTEPEQLGWEPVVQSWINTLPESMQDFHDHIWQLFKWLLEPTLEYIRLNTKVIVANSVPGHVTNLIRLMDALLGPFKQEDFKAPSGTPNLLEGLFVYSLVWSVGANTNSEGRAKINAYLRSLLNGEDETVVEEFQKRSLSIPLPNKGSIYDFMFSFEKKKWTGWMDTIAKISIPADAKFENIIVPTISTVRGSYILDTLIHAQRHLLFTGPTGTGKSVMVYQKILQDLPREKWDPICLTFSAQTSAPMTQEIIQGKLSKRTKTIRGPKMLGKRGVIFVDDINMPQKEEYGAQPPIELLRQYMDYGGWYDNNLFLNLVDIQFVAAMGVPGGGKNVINGRFMRHFNILATVEFDSESLEVIYSTIVNWWLTNNSLAGVAKVAKSIVGSTVKMYDTLIKELKPTPGKSHYTFNLRDISSVFQGILSSACSKLKVKQDMLAIWAHECQRVFGDRLVNGEDTQWFDDVLYKEISDTFKVDFVKDVLDGDKSKHVIFTNFHSGDDYCICDSSAQLKEVVEENLNDYNEISGTPMDLVMFDAAVAHVCRIARVIRQPYGNCLLVGVGGSGRQSLTKLATQILSYEFMQVEVSASYSLFEWREDLKKLMVQTGQEGKPTTFLFTDTQIKFESMLEDINNILNNGEVPGLFLPEELAPVIEEMGKIAKEQGKPLDGPSLYSLFVERCKQNIHICLCLSPVGSSFRERVRMFPALVNCCTIDWYHRWPNQALESVATKFLSSIKLDPEIREKCVQVCVSIHESVIETSQEFLERMQWHTYATPTSYLDLLKTFKNLFENERTRIGDAKKRYDIGLEKLRDTQETVATMKKELEALQPQLRVAVTETNELMETLKLKNAAAGEQKAVVSKDEAACNEKEAQASAIAAECKEKLDVAMPAYEKAIAALSCIKSSDLAQVRKYAQPPSKVVLTLEAVCIMLSVKPKTVGEVGNKRKDYWGPAKTQVLGDTRLLQKLMSYDKDNIPDSIISRIQVYMDNPEFDPDNVATASQACKGLCLWVCAMYTYNTVAKVIGPMKESLAVAETEAAEAAAALAEKKAELKKVTDLLDALNKQYGEAVAKKDSLQNQVEECTIKLARAEKLISGLGGEYKSWEAKSLKLGKDYDNVVGDILIASGIIAYLGIYTSTFREEAIRKWIEVVNNMDIGCADPFSLVDTLGDPILIKEWVSQKLPKDYFSTSNAIILQKSIRFPLFVDPQGQANRWIRNMEKNNELSIMKLHDADLQRVIENSVQFGRPVLIENVGESLPPLLVPILLQQTFKLGNRLMIRLGDQTIEYDPSFRLYITTKLRCPHYTPNISTKVVLVNFMATLEGLDDQMLGIVVSKDEPEREAKREQLVLEQAKMQKQLRDIEDKILHLLSSATGNILDDEELIDTLQSSKTASKQIERRVAEAKVIEADINKVRSQYTWLSRSSANLFFCVSDLGSVDPMYQYSLDWFLNLFMRSIEKADVHEDKALRTKSIDEVFKFALYENVCRSLFEKDKLLFSFLLALRILDEKKLLNRSELRFLLTGGGVSQVDPSNPNPAPKWLEPRGWGEIRMLANATEFFKGFDKFVKDEIKEWKALFDSKNPETHLLPGKYKGCDPLQRLCILRCFRQDKITDCVQNFVSDKIGDKFIRPPPFDLEGPYSDSSPTSPLLFVLSPGSDPINELLKIAERKGFDTGKLVSISLGQGQDKLAERAVAEAIKRGTWVILQNCHLYPSWMPSLEKIVEEINPENVHPDFRLWLTSMPSKQFPISILQNGVKITNEPPKGMQANLLKTYNALDAEWFESCNKKSEFKKVMFALAFFHAIVQERRKFGSLGWNIPYEFNESDLRISYDQLMMFMNESAEDSGVPFKTLCYMTGELNYGGRVTDDKDRRTILTILNGYYCEALLQDEFRFCSLDEYYAPHEGPLETYIEYIQQLPMSDDPEIFGLHANSIITSGIKESNALLNTVLSVQPRSSAGDGDSREDTIRKLAHDIDSQLPDCFDVEQIQKKYPVVYSECMNTVLVQELMRFNRLLSVVKKSMKDIVRALAGEIVMSPELESLADSMYAIQVPESWSAVSYPSLKPLGSYVSDLKQRLDFLQNWVDNGIPKTFWISGFFFTQSFLTGTLQNHARRKEISIDQLSFDFVVVPDVTPETEAPETGCYINGLFLEGAGWDAENVRLCESNPKQLFVEMPMIWLKPMVTTEIDRTRMLYPCPVYKTSRRAGALSTTGHSTNYVLTINLPSDQPEGYWVKRGVAMLCQLDV